MKSPNATQFHNPNPEYVTQLVQQLKTFGFTVLEICKLLGISSSALYDHMRTDKRYRPMPYCTQYTLEALIEHTENAFNVETKKPKA